MKKIILSLMALGLALTIQAQNFYKVETAVNDKKYDEAFAQYQALKLKDTKNKMKTNPEAYYWLGMIYQKLSDTPIVATKIAELKNTNLVIEALNQFRQCLALNKDYPALRLVGGQPLYSMYAKNFQGGIDDFNDKKFDVAIQKLILADSAGKFIFHHKFGLSALDTQLYYYTGLAYVNATTDEKDATKLSQYKMSAEKYFSTLVDANVKQGMNNVCKWALSIAMGDANATWFNKYIAFAKNNYPEDAKIWTDFETEFVIKSAGDDKMKVVDAYKTLQAKEPNNYAFFYNEAVELFDYLSQNMHKFDEFLPELQRVANEAFKLKSDAYQPLYLVQKSYMGKIDSYGDSIRDVQKLQRAVAEKYAKIAKGSAQEKEKNKQLEKGKAQITKYESLQKKYAQVALPVSLQLEQYFDAKANTLQSKDKGIYREMLDNLSTFYGLIKDIDNADKYSNKSNKIK